MRIIVPKSPDYEGGYAEAKIEIRTSYAFTIGKMFSKNYADNLSKVFSRLVTLDRQQRCTF